MATDVAQKRLTLSRVLKDTGSGLVPAIRVERRYNFIDADDKPLADIAVGRFVVEISISSIPGSILDALQAIDDWTYQKILDKEGMA
jgi:hypothetical protein